MEDQSSETYSDIIKILTETRKSVGTLIFFSNLWKVITSASNTRLAGIKYLSDNIPGNLKEG